MANSPYKMKNALGSDMAGKSNQVGAGAKPAAGGGMFQGSVPGGNQRPYWQTTSSSATQGVPAYQPFVMPKGQQAIGGSDDYYAPGGGADQAIAGETTGTVDSGGSVQWYDLPNGGQTRNQYEAALAWQKYNALTSVAADSLGATPQAPVPSTQTKGYISDPAPKYQNEQSAYVTEMLKSLLGQIGSVDWQAQQKQGLDALAKQQALSMYQLGQQQAARGLGGGGSYLGGADQRIAATQDATKNFLLDQQKQQVAQQQALAQLQAAIGGQIGEMGMQDAAFGYQQTLGEQERMFAYLQALANMQQAGVDFFPGKDYTDTLDQLMQAYYGGGKANG